MEALCRRATHTWLSWDKAAGAVPQARLGWLWAWLLHEPQGPPRLHPWVLPAQGWGSAVGTWAPSDSGYGALKRCPELRRPLASCSSTGSSVSKRRTMGRAQDLGSPWDREHLRGNGQRVKQHLRGIGVGGSFLPSPPPTVWSELPASRGKTENTLSGNTVHLHLGLLRGPSGSSLHDSPGGALRNASSSGKGAPAPRTSIFSLTAVPAQWRVYSRDRKTDHSFQRAACPDSEWALQPPTASSQM